MPRFQRKDIALHYQDQGDPTGPTVVFANSLGTNLHLWDQVVARLPPDLRIIRYDKRGHGQSAVPSGPYTMGALVHDVERLLDMLEVRECMFVGL